MYTAPFLTVFDGINSLEIIWFLVMRHLYKTVTGDTDLKFILFWNDIYF